VDLAGGAFDEGRQVCREFTGAGSVVHPVAENRREFGIAEDDGVMRMIGEDEGLGVGCNDCDCEAEWCVRHGDCPFE